MVSGLPKAVWDPTSPLKNIRQAIRRKECIWKEISYSTPSATVELSCSQQNECRTENRVALYPKFGLSGNEWEKKIWRHFHRINGRIKDGAVEHGHEHAMAKRKTVGINKKNIRKHPNERVKWLSSIFESFETQIQTDLWFVVQRASRLMAFPCPLRPIVCPVVNRNLCT